MNNHIPDHEENPEILELSGDRFVNLIKVLLMLLAGGIPIAYLTYLSIVR